MNEEYDFDVLIIGSGFGGSVSALRLAEKGYKVGLIEQGRRLSADDLNKAGNDSKYLTWAPALGRYGFLAQDIYQHMGVVRGIAVGGGSIVYAAVLLEPTDAFYNDPTWTNLSANWKQELQPYYQTAKKMLGVTVNPYQGIQDEWLHQTAYKMNAQDSFSSVPQGIYFGKTDRLTPDPILGRKGPDRTGCNLCGRCITGCSFGAKNSLDKNYLYLAEQLGVKIISESKVSHIEPFQHGYKVHRKHPWKNELQTVLCAEKIILSAGVIGTLEILFASRDRYKTLPDISSQLGKHVRTNSEAIVSVLSKDTGVDVSQGTTISSHFHPDQSTHITQNRFPASYDFMKFYMGPLIAGRNPWQRALTVLKHLLLHPFSATRPWRTKEWYKRVTVLTVMQQADNELCFSYGRTLFKGFRHGLISGVSKGKRSPSFIAVANQAAQTMADINGGTAHNVLLESVGNLSVTAHLLGGAVMSDNSSQGVINAENQVFNYANLYVVDGSSIPVNVGVNPSLTITALAERFAAKVNAKHKHDN